MYRLAFLSLALLLGSACERPAPPPEPEPEVSELLVRCGSLVDGLSEKAAHDKLVVIRGGRIAAVLDGDDASASDGDVIDLPNYTCLPGLIDMHVHLDGYPDDYGDLTVYLRRTPDDTRRLSEEIAGVVLNKGFTSVRHVGAYHAWVDRDLRDRIDSGAVAGPRVQVGGPYLTIPKGGGDLYIPGVADEDIPSYYRKGVAQGPLAFRKRAEEVVDGGADFIKVIASGAVFGIGGDPGASEMTREEITAVVEVAKAAGIKVTAHAHGADTIKDAILAGVDSIEHASLADDEAIALAAEHGVAFVMDVYNGTYTEEVGREKGYADEYMEKNELTTEAQRIAFEKALQAGVDVLFGTDLGVLPHDLGAKQFEVMVERGMSPMQAIKSATSAAAEHMEWQADIGAIEAGRYGDLIAVKGNPLRDISLLQQVDLVIKNGEIVRNDTVPGSPHADVVYHTGKIYTVNEAQPWAQAVAIRNDRIVFVGSDDRVRRYIGPETKTHDLRGRMMLPAFQDAHIHPISSALDYVGCNLYDDDTLDEYLATIAECAKSTPDGEWIDGGGWLMSVFGPGALADKALLDEIVPDNPVYLESKDGHSAWVNSAALRAAGIDDDTPDPDAGIIDRDPETGEAIGSLQENAVNLVYGVMPEPTVEQNVAAMRYTRDYLHALGITAIQTGYTYADQLAALQILDKAGELQLHVSAPLFWDDTDNSDQLPRLLEERDRFSGGNVRVLGAKLFQDGVLENYTGALLEPYDMDGGGKSMAIFEQDRLNDIVIRLDAAGFQFLCHAIGDGAARHCLDAIEVARNTNGARDLRHHLIHLQLIHPDDYARFGELEVIANFSPYWASADEYVTELTNPFIGEERAARQYPINSILDAGGRVVFGSDWAVSSADPLLGIETAIRRIDPDLEEDEPLNIDQAITLEQAIRAYTIDAAFVNHHEEESGSIEVGKLADLVVLDKNLFDIEPTEINDAKVVVTLFGGQPVYGDPDAL